jgi:DNA mismatch endonuclease (patch repair protein)
VHRTARLRGPSFAGLKPSSLASSAAKRANTSTGTRPELRLRRELWKLGLRYQKNVRVVPGKPDICFLAAKVAVFCDGDFWHGRNWSVLEAQLQRRANSAYWIAKIRTNRLRDVRTRRRLRRSGWTVIRVWETDIRRDPAGAARRLAELIARRAD